MKFLVTSELGRLLKWLRILGYDAVYSQVAKKAELIIRSLREDRLILTRNHKIKSIGGMNIVYLKSDFFVEQLKQLTSDLILNVNKDKLFSRCLICNVPLKLVDKDRIKQKVPPYVYKTQESFRQCPVCGKIYWPGTHWHKVEKIIGKIKQVRLDGNYC